MKLAVIGGGSTYTPELADGIGRLLPQVEELVLVDPDPDRLAVVGPVSARIMAARDHPAEVRRTGRLAEGADGADAILFQLRIGGQAASAHAAQRRGFIRSGHGRSDCAAPLPGRTRAAGDIETYEHASDLH